MRYGPWMPGTPKLTEEEKALRRECYRIFNRARNRGEILPPQKCEKCPAEGPVMAHHHDYREPLAVIWVCEQCHANAHVRMVMGKNLSPPLTS